MPVYPTAGPNASCVSPNCPCHNRLPRYPSDLTDAQWAVLQPEARAAMADLVRCSGRPMVHDLRAMVDAVGYVTRYGIEWRALPADFPPHPAVYAFFERWSARGLPQRLVDVLRGRIRIAHGRAPLPTAGSIDSQSVKAADTVGNASRGYDGGKKINGRKRHIAVDTLGLLLVVFVTPASVQDRDGAHPLLALLRQRFSTITLIWADGGYAGPAGHLGQVRAAPGRDHRQTQRRHHRVRGAASPLGSGTHLRLAAETPPPGPRLRTTTRAPRSDGPVGDRVDHDTAADPRTGRPTTRSPMGPPAPPRTSISRSSRMKALSTGSKGNPPLPASPVGALGLKPAVTSTADPFTTPGVSISSVYGTNYRWWWYDNGCGAGSDIMPALTTNIANVIGLQIPGLLLAIGQGLFTAVIDPSGWIGFLDKPIEHATASVAAGVWFPFLSLTLLLVAVVTLLRAARGRLSGTITATVWALTVLVLVTWVVGYPTESVKMLDSGIQTAVVTTAQGFSPQAQQVGPQASSNTPTEASARAQAVAAMDAQWDTINRSTVYRSWLAGVFGNADSPTAAKFGPTVFRATHFTWAEYDTYQRDPTGAGKQIVDRKAGEFRQVAEQLSGADPVAYQFFTGNMTGDRLGTAVLCLFITLIVTVFFIAAGLLTVLGYAVARLIVPATPAAGVFFLLDSFRELALSWGQRIVKVLVMGPMAFLASLVLFAFTSAIFTATMPDGLKYLFITALSWLAWRLMRPHTALGRMHMPGQEAARAGAGHETRPSRRVRQALGLRLRRRGRA